MPSWWLNLALHASIHPKRHKWLWWGSTQSSFSEAPSSNVKVNDGYARSRNPNLTHESNKKCKLKITPNVSKQLHTNINCSQGSFSPYLRLHIFATWHCLMDPRQQIMKKTQCPAWPVVTCLPSRNPWFVFKASKQVQTNSLERDPY